MGSAQGIPSINQDPVKQAAIVKRRLRVMQLRADGLTFRDIAKELDVSVGLVHRDFEASLTRVLEPNVEAYRAEHVARLAKMRAVAQDVIDRRHLIVSVSGKVVRDDNGDPIEDDTIVLQAMDRIHKLDEAERKLLGLDARPEIAITGTLAYEVVGLGLPSGDDKDPG